jgi:predicted ATP-grasp superfamily ATP-dependent carboligase
VGHRIGVCDPDPLCLGRFSRFVDHYYRCPALGEEPWAYLDFVVALLSQGGWEVLFPTHEQAFLFSREKVRIPPAVALAISPFESFLQIQGKVALVRTLARLSIPQPASVLAQMQDDLEGCVRFPVYLKAEYATASTAVWRILNARELKSKFSELRSQGLWSPDQEFVIQEAVQGALERAQAVFHNGRLVAIHGYRQTVAGLGGGDVVKLSVRRPEVNRYVERLGAGLQWHGALSVDYIVRQDDQSPLFIDVNPRLVEPMNAVLAGVNLADVLVRVSTDAETVDLDRERGEVRTHMLLMALLAAAARRRRRSDVFLEVMRAVIRRGVYANSREELLPIWTDFKSTFPLAYVLARLLLSPASAETLSRGAIESYCLSPDAAREIANRGRFERQP